MTSTPSLVSQIGQPYSQPNTASGGTPPYTYSVGSGNLPQGATLNTSTGLVSGTLTGAAGSFIYTIEAVDVNGQKISAGTVGSTAPPTVTSVNPSQGPAAGGQSVIITGTNFSGATSVTIVSPLNIPPPISVPFAVLAPNPPNGQAATQISIKTPPHVPGAVDIAVTTPAGSASSSGGIYTFNAGPSVATISPATGPLTGDQPVTITGTNFDPALDVRHHWRRSGDGCERSPARPSAPRRRRTRLPGRKASGRYDRQPAARVRSSTATPIRTSRR